MPLTTAVKAQVIKIYKQSKNDVGSSQVQIALLSARISSLTEHLKSNKNDFHTRRGLTNMVSRRRRLMGYLKRTNPQSYQQIIKELEIRG
ncbi:MAG TPA: 30S ribosomal protein S15 [Gammaproteobacteria bacterium]|jgi:small subunit ribosomal protein S15|nr:30S ribosomal protein S15 [Gammaproteobacteria bacterium]